MTRLGPIAALLALLVTTSCDKKEPAPVERPGDSAAAKKPPKDKDKPAVAPVEAPETVTKTGVLDLELATRGSRYTVRNATFDLTFPVRPTVQEQTDKGADGTVLHSGLALGTKGSEELGFFVMPIPKDVAYDVKKGLTGARDGAMNNIGATILSETDTKIGGLAGRKVSASAMNGGQKLFVDLFLAWDEPHRQLFGVFTSSPSSTPSQTGTDFVGSLKVKAPKAPPPPDPNAPEKVTKTDVLGLEIIEKAGMFTLHDEAYWLTFPTKPEVQRTDSTAPDGTKLPGAVATATIGQDQGYGMILMMIPDGVSYDAKKGLKAARDGMLRQVGAKLQKETATTIAGVPGRRATASVTIQGKQLTLELQFAYDKKRHAVFGLYSATPTGAMSAAAMAFFSSFEIKG
jgi:hypothetical protein